MAKQTCTVSVVGLREEVQHQVTVEADSLFEAATRGLASLQKGSWSAEDAVGAAVLQVTVQPPAVVHRVKVADLRAWLRGGGRSPAERLERQRLKALLDQTG